ncbi:Putative G3BP-like protein [Leucoagaricus sp. SymC.cos]|nr:Putative G3BP-like protein [Leucoagaricus sp. SymC.cos]
MSSSTTSTPIHQNVVPSEVGWQFVPQYYTFVNKQPNRLHCFYTKSSTFVHGNEGEESKPCFGQHEIHEKITSIGFQDCKVFIHSVDAQASANGGIIIQVIGEMSNRGEGWRKFVQTFFLAEQPNGYFVLNDIFRFLKEDSVESDDADEAAEPEVAPAEPEPAPATEAPQTPAREPTPPPAVAAAAPSPVPSFPAPAEEPPTNDVPEPAPQPPTPAPEPQPAPAAAPAQPNGHSAAPEPEKPAPPAPAPLVAEKSPAPTPAPQQPTPAAAPVPSAPAAPLAAPPASAVPSAPRSWASLAASNPKKWGPTVAQESRGTTEMPASPAPSSGTQTPAGAASSAPAPSRGHSNRPDHPALPTTQPLSTAAVFIKGIVDPVTNSQLQNILTSRFGPLKEIEVVRSKACAFAEFNTVESARRAITASMNEGGVYIDAAGEGNQVRIVIETRKERGDRPPTRPRGGAPVNGEGRGGHGGGYRGRGAGRGRGGPPPGK